MDSYNYQTTPSPYPAPGGWYANDTTNNPSIVPHPPLDHQGSSSGPNAHDDSPTPDEEDDPNDRSFAQESWDRAYKYSAEGVAEMRAKWQVEYANLPMPPPPPATYPSKAAAIAGTKAFAKDHGYVITISHSYKDKKTEEINRILMRCELAGKYRNQHKITPEMRVRNRFSRKTDCPMKVRLQKKKFSDEWVLVIVNAQHNHASIALPAVPPPSTVPDLEAALYDWHTSELSKGEAVHGNTLKQKALALFAEMPQYRGQQPPNMDKEWLDLYRRRHNLPVRQHRPARQPELVDWSTADPATIAAANAASSQPQQPAMTLSKGYTAFAGLESILPDATMLKAIRTYVEEYMSRYDASHDFDHVLRVFCLSKYIWQQERQQYGAMQYDPQVVLLTALVHDVGDHKYQRVGENPENQIAELLLDHHASPELAMKIQLIAKNVSFSNEVKNPRMMKAVMDQHPELAIVQDADRLDAIGAIGIGRTFTYSGAKQSDRGMEGTLAHFTEKLERLESMMKTETGRRLARERTHRLQLFRQWWDEEDKLMA